MPYHMRFFALEGSLEQQINKFEEKRILSFEVKSHLDDSSLLLWKSRLILASMPIPK